MTSRPPTAEEAVLIGKTVRIVESDWPKNIGWTGRASWEARGYTGEDSRTHARSHHWLVDGRFGSRIELVADDAILIKEETTVADEAPPTPLERRAWALRWAKETYPDGTDIDHMTVADWLLKGEEETVTYPIYHPPASEEKPKDTELPISVGIRDSQSNTVKVTSKDGADEENEVAWIAVNGSLGYLTAPRAKRVIEVLQRAINRA